MKQLYNKEVGKIYETNDYSMFKRLNGNRHISEAWVKKIAQSMETYGWIGGPVLVNQMMEELDGQHRIEGAERTDTPIRYTVIDGDIQDVQIINNTRQWKMPEYINSYIERGNENYIRLYEVMKQFSATYANVLRAANISTNDVTKEQMKSGRLIFTEAHKAKAMEKLPLVYEIMNAMSAIGFRGDKTPKEIASLFVVEHYDESVVKKLCAAIMRATPTYLSTMNTQSLLDSFERIYNKGKSSPEKIFFGTDYKLDARAVGVEIRIKKYKQYNNPETMAKKALGIHQ